MIGDMEQICSFLFLRIQMQWLTKMLTIHKYNSFARPHLMLFCLLYIARYQGMQQLIQNSTYVFGVFFLQKNTFYLWGHQFHVNSQNHRDTNCKMYFKKNNKMYLWNTMPLVATKSKNAIFSIKEKVKVTRSFVSFERASVEEYVCQIWSLYCDLLHILINMTVLYLKAIK